MIEPTVIMPVIMAGIRTATVMIVGIAAVTAYVGAGGLGELIFQGISRSSEAMIIVGASSSYQCLPQIMFICYESCKIVIL